MSEQTTNTLQKKLNDRAIRRLEREVDSSAEDLDHMLGRIPHGEAELVMPVSGPPGATACIDARLMLDGIKKLLNARLRETYIAEETGRFLEQVAMVEQLAAEKLDN